MGMPARKLATTARGAGRERKPQLRLVSADARPLQAASRSAARKRDGQAAEGPVEAAYRSAFQVVVVALVTLTILALARVTLSAKAAEASIDQLTLERTIKAETQVADRLELDRSLLVTPSRIESIAVGLQMTKAPAVSYITVPQETSAARPRPAATRVAAGSATGDTLAGMLGAALEVTQKEARTLLVGDVGVAASR